MCLCWTGLCVCVFECVLSVLCLDTCVCVVGVDCECLC